MPPLPGGAGRGRAGLAVRRARRDHPALAPGRGRVRRVRRAAARLGRAPHAAAVADGPGLDGHRPRPGRRRLRSAARPDPGDADLLLGSERPGRAGRRARRDGGGRRRSRRPGRGRGGARARATAGGAAARRAGAPGPSVGTAVVAVDQRRGVRPRPLGAGRGGRGPVAVAGPAAGLGHPAAAGGLGAARRRRAGPGPRRGGLRGPAPTLVSRRPRRCGERAPRIPG
ncbi:hypothetical protein NOCARDAX2BIS_150061 [Nocardioides sp. AX2bis]|nr:hypothetical protein NOCARDAX2BIS_150061 [Nocardioides sp. AX2bis]